MKSKKLIFLNAILLLFVSMASCDKDNDLYFPGKVKTNNGGDFVIKNLTNGETLVIEGALHLGTYQKLSVTPSDIISVEFQPYEEYENLVFNISFDFPTKTFEDKYYIEYQIPEDLKGIYKVYLNAKSEGENKDLIWNINTSAGFDLEVIEEKAEEVIDEKTEEETEEEEGPDVEVNILISKDGGDFVVTNTNTSEFIRLESAIYIGNYPQIEASIGDHIKVEFQPKEEYTKCKFDILYEFPNENFTEGYEADYYVTDDLEGKNTVFLNAVSKGSNKNKFWDITAQAVFNIVIN